MCKDVAKQNRAAEGCQRGDHGVQKKDLRAGVCEICKISLRVGMILMK